MRDRNPFQRIANTRARQQSRIVAVDGTQISNCRYFDGGLGQIGGVPALTAVLTISTGITGACLASYVLRLVGVKEWHARGFAMGLSSHGIATARAFQENEIAGTFAGLAMALNGIATAAFVPLIVKLLDRVG